jgi:hypothetical protein
VTPDRQSQKRLRAHVDAILDAAHVPASEIEDVAEELYGHLVEAWVKAFQEGLTGDEATSHAIRAFGEPDTLGPQLTESFHSRLWASTIGLLLTPGSDNERPPTAVGTQATALLATAALVAVLGVGIAIHHTPLRAIFALLVCGGCVVGLLQTRQALLIGHGWALAISFVVLLVLVAEGIVTFTTSAGHTFSLSGIAAALVLLAAVHNYPTLRAWAAGVPQAGPRRELTSTALILAVGLLPIGLSVPDPMQPTPADLHLSASMHCNFADSSGSVTATFRWDRVPFLAGGIAHITDYGDQLLVELPPGWAMAYDNPFVRDIETGGVVGEPILLPPSGMAVEALRKLNAPAMIGIEAAKLRAGHTYRVTWPVSLWEDGEPTIQASVEYWHLDQFRMETLIDCAGTVEPPFVDRSIPSEESLTGT